MLRLGLVDLDLRLDQPGFDLLLLDRQCQPLLVSGDQVIGDLADPADDFADAQQVHVNSFSVRLIQPSRNLLCERSEVLSTGVLGCFITFDMTENLCVVWLCQILGTREV